MSGAIQGPDENTRYQRLYPKAIFALAANQERHLPKDCAKLRQKQDI